MFIICLTSCCKLQSVNFGLTPLLLYFLGFFREGGFSLFFGVQPISIPWLQPTLCSWCTKSEQLLVTTSRLLYCFQPGNEEIQDNFFPGFVLYFEDIRAAISGGMSVIVVVCFLMLSARVAEISHATCLYTIES